MQLILYREDLKPEHIDVNCSLLRLEHFNDTVQRVVGIVGRAQFREYDNSSYNAILPDKLDHVNERARPKFKCRCCNHHELHLAKTLGAILEARCGSYTYLRDFKLWNSKESTIFKVNKSQIYQIAKVTDFDFDKVKKGVLQFRGTRYILAF
jgi:hypothetical protein